MYGMGIFGDDDSGQNLSDSLTADDPTQAQGGGIQSVIDTLNQDPANNPTPVPSSGGGGSNAYVPTNSGSSSVKGSFASTLGTGGMILLGVVGVAVLAAALAPKKGSSSGSRYQANRRRRTRRRR